MPHPPRTKRLWKPATYALLAASLLASVGLAAPPEAPRVRDPLDTRRTPLVKALRKARHAVVNIHSQKSAARNEAVFAAGKDRKVNGMGTGIVVDERGYVVTNFHVVDGVESLKVTLPTGGTYSARVVSYDRKRDLSIIKIEPSEPLKVMPMGTSSDLMLGESVIAVGNAFGYENTVTSGIISALSRDVEVNETQAYKNLIQTDAAINPGNSGGPLINVAGEVIGINVAIRAGAQRIGFAIPIDDARRTIARLMSVDRLEGIWHGLVTRDVKTSRRRELVISSARPGSPAAEAGFKPGDVIVKVAGGEVMDRADLERRLLGRKPGEKVTFVVRRDKKQETIPLALARLSSEAVAAKETDVVVRGNMHDEPPDPAVVRAWRVLGVRVAPLSKNEPGLAGSRYRGGMRVTAVRPTSPAANNGIRPGDILVGLHIWETISLENVSYVLEHPQFKSFSPLKFYIVRGRDTLFGHLRVASH